MKKKMYSLNSEENNIIGLYFLTDTEVTIMEEAFNISCAYSGGVSFSLIPYEYFQTLENGTLKECCFEEEREEVE